LRHLSSQQLRLRIGQLHRVARPTPVRLLRGINFCLSFIGLTPSQTHNQGTAKAGSPLTLYPQPENGHLQGSMSPPDVSPVSFLSPTNKAASTKKVMNFLEEVSVCLRSVIYSANKSGASRCQSLFGHLWLWCLYGSSVFSVASLAAFVVSPPRLSSRLRFSSIRR
jgi:hypothetical protein